MQFKVATAIFFTLMGFALAAPVPGSTYQEANPPEPRTNLGTADLCEGSVASEGTASIEGVQCLKN